MTTPEPLSNAFSPQNTGGPSDSHSGEKRLWSDEQIMFQYREAFGEPPDIHLWAFIAWLCEAYEAERAAHLARIADLEAKLIGATELVELQAMFQQLTAGKLDDVRASVHDYVANRLLAGTRAQKAPAVPTADIRELLAIYLSDLNLDHWPRSRLVAERVRLWLDSLEPQP